jgi:hypothetical protein
LHKRKASVAATLLTLALAGCGGSSGATSGSGPSLSGFKTGFTIAKVQFRRLGSDLGTAVEKAGAKTDVQLAAEFDKLSARAKGQAAALRKLDPPAKFKSELSHLSTSLDSVATDLGGIASAANAHDATKAKAATTTLITDAAKVKTADNALTAQLGLPKTG